MFAQFVDRTDIRVVESRRGSGLALHALKCSPIAGNLGQKLHGYATAQFDVFRLIYNAHAAAAQLA